jgi:hypothetical protein
MKDKFHVDLQYAFIYFFFENLLIFIIILFN